MNWENQLAPESRVGPPNGSDSGPEQPRTPADVSTFIGHPLEQSTTSGRDLTRHVITVSKTRLSAEGNGNPAEIFTLTLGDETIQLLPLRNWGQLDVYKWRVQGKLPGTPAGLEVTFEHVKIGGETVGIGDPDGCTKLQNAFDEWLTLENNDLALARKALGSRPRSTTSSSSREGAQQSVQFRVASDKRGQVHIKCLRGAETLTSVGLTVQGFNGLFNQGLMRKPRTLVVGALHDWVELDGDLCSFEHGNDDTAKLEKLLNERYAPLTEFGAGKDILVFANAASPTGFDVQFSVTVGGVSENRRRTLNDAALELMQEPIRCGLLRPGLIIKRSPPTFIFKRKTPDGGEAYLEKTEENTVRVLGDDGRERQIALSQPVNYTRLSVVELMAVFNHPAVTRHSESNAGLGKRAEETAEPAALPDVPTTPAQSPSSAWPRDKTEFVQKEVAPVLPEAELAKPAPPVMEASRSHTPPETGRGREGESIPPPNAWLQEILSRTPIRYDWFACLAYFKIAERFGNSREGDFGPCKCWSVALGVVVDVEGSDFKGVFLTQKGGLGFLGHGRMVRFHRGVVFLGTRDSVLEGIDINLLAVGLDDQDRVVFIVTDNYLPKFGATTHTIEQELTRLREAGASLLSVREALESPRQIKVVWTVPAEQPNPSDPQAIESIRAATACPVVANATGLL
jgi:hypothetical protein